jgi:hypothetical protein
MLYIPRFHKKNSLYEYIERGVCQWKEAQRQDNFMNNFNVYTYIYMPQNIYMGL